MSALVVTPKDLLYPIQPVHIDTSHTFEGVFDSIEDGISATRLVQMAQNKGGWCSFTENDFRKSWGRNSWVNGLSEEDKELLVLRNDRYYFTHEFIAICFKSSPAYTPSRKIHRRELEE